MQNLNQFMVTGAIDLRGIAPLLQVYDMSRALSFYNNILGFQIIQSAPEGIEPDWVLLKMNDIEIMLNTAYERGFRPAEPDPARIDAHKDTTLYFGCPDVDNLYTILLSNGLALREPFITGYGWKALEITDADGYQLCFHWPMK